MSFTKKQKDFHNEMALTPVNPNEMALIPVNTNIGVIHIHIINQIPIIGTNMVCNRYIIVIETESKRYCALSNDDGSKWFRAGMPKNSCEKIDQNNIINDCRLLLFPSKQIPSIITFNDDHLFSSIKINFMNYMNNSNPPDVDLSVHKNTIQEIQFIAYEYDDQSIKTNIDTPQFLNMVKKLLKMEQGIPFTVSDKQTEVLSKDIHTRTDNLSEKEENKNTSDTSEISENDINNFFEVISDFKKKYDMLKQENHELRQIIESFNNL
jgi:hypothetical protein